ncbi:MAG: SPOR domain-containing protein [Hydrogenophilaceae bacterium]|nr:SPOR domain-containing protein [Hydrogenophilaceae bacterium]
MALTILAVILLPLVLEDEPPPTGPLKVLMPPPPEKTTLPENAVEYAPPSANSTIEPASPEDKTPAMPIPQNAQNPVEPARPTEEIRKVESDKPLASETETAAFVVQVGVFSDKGNVQKVQSRISALGLRSYTEQVGNATRVRLGSFSTRAEADAVAAKLADAGVPGKVVEK